MSLKIASFTAYLSGGIFLLQWFFALCYPLEERSPSAIKRELIFFFSLPILAILGLWASFCILKADQRLASKLKRLPALLLGLSPSLFVLICVLGGMTMWSLASTRSEKMVNKIMSLEEQPVGKIHAR